MISARGQYLSDMQRPNSCVLAMQHALYVHEAGIVAGRADFGASTQYGSHLITQHRSRDFGIL
ncbi:MAG: hypothetical protein WAK33_24245, partial [Silvibacterium sp.]